MLYLQIASPKSSVLNFLDSNSFEVIISIFQRTEKVPDMERLRKYKWIGHTHPGHDVICLTPSDSDYDVLNKLNQKRSVIYNSVCMYYIFGEEESI